MGCRCARAWPSGHASVVSFHGGAIGLRAGASGEAWGRKRGCVEERDEKNKRGEEKIRALRSFHSLRGVVLLNILSKQLQLY